MQNPHDARQPEDYMAAAEDALEAAKVLAGQGRISDQDFLERMARSDSMVDHDGETCGMCHNMILGAQVAREMIEAREYEDVVSKWASETRRRWEASCAAPSRLASPLLRKTGWWSNSPASAALSPGAGRTAR